MKKALIVIVVFMISRSTYIAIGSAQNPNNTIIVYYFHGTVRCPSCTLLEELIRDAIEIEKFLKGTQR